MLEAADVFDSRFAWHQNVPSAGNYDTIGSDMKADASVVDKSPGAGRPRDPRIDAAILRATAELLVEIGYSSLTMAAVAERAGTTKTALYRRWSSKAELVHEAAFPAAPTAIETPPGDITADIRAMIDAASEVFTSPLVRAALPGLISDMVADAELNARVRSDSQARSPPCAPDWPTPSNAARCTLTSIRTGLSR